MKVKEEHLGYCNDYSLSMLNFIKHVIEQRGHAVASQVVAAINNVTEGDKSQEWFNQRMKEQAQFDGKTSASGGVLRSEDRRVQPCHRRFLLQRLIDASGVSGTGVVAEGVVFSTGQVVLCWLRSTHDGRGSVATYDSIEQCQQIHGHHGQTMFVFKE